MKFKNGLDLVLGSSTKLRLLRTLVAAPRKIWTGRELAVMARVSTAQAARDMNALLDVGVVHREVRGKAYFWRLSEQHVLTPELSRLFGFEARLKQTLAQDVARLLAHIPTRRALLFGSVARGDEREDSDVDLFVEVRSVLDKRATVSALGRVRDRIWDRYGNPVTFLVYTGAEVRNPRNPSLIESIARDGIEVLGT